MSTQGLLFLHEVEKEKLKKKVISLSFMSSNMAIGFNLLYLAQES